jgi:hypothetical protein
VQLRDRRAGLRRLHRLQAHADAASLSAALKAACPDGIDGYFENVGGMVLDAVLPRMNAFGRIAVCGMISGYDGEPIPMASPQLILISRLKLQGFIVSEHMEVWPEALKELGRSVGPASCVPRVGVRGHRLRAGGLPRACSRAATSASSWSSWSDPTRQAAPMAMLPPEPTHEVFNQPDPLVDYNLFARQPPALQARSRFNAPAWTPQSCPPSAPRWAAPMQTHARLANVPTPPSCTPRPLRPAHRPGRVPPQLPRADGCRHRRRPARHALGRRQAPGTTCARAPASCCSPS